MTDGAPSVPGRHPVTSGMRIAAAWSWRFLVVVAALAILYYGLGYVSEITVPVTIALLLCALLNPVKRFLVDHGWRPGLAATVVFVGGLLIVAGIITLVVEQFVAGSADLAARVGTGLDTVQTWLVTGPFKVSQDQIDSVVTSIKQAVLDNREAVTSGAVTTATSAGRVLTGLVLVMFILFFFLRDGKKIWDWIVGLAPRRARSQIDGAANRAWWTLGGYVRATVLVAFVDAIGIGLGLVILGVPLAFPLIAFVFLASFIPIIGALLSGVVAVLVALVTVGLVKAIIILIVVIAVQQLEAHVLQPVLAVALTITAGVIIAGITGALLAVPLAACANAAVKFLVGKENNPADSKDTVELALDNDTQPGEHRTHQ
jgi:predicted PurR-regulated permease PerM